MFLRCPHRFPPSVEPDATCSAVGITDILQQLQDTALTAHQAVFHDAKLFYDKHWTDKQYESGQEVYLGLSQLGKQLNSHNSLFLPKLRINFVGPITIDRVLSPVNYKLILLPFYIGYPVLHIIHLHIEHRLSDDYFVSPYSLSPL